MYSITALSGLSLFVPVMETWQSSVMVLGQGLVNCIPFLQDVLQSYPVVFGPCIARKFVSFSQKSEFEWTVSERESSNEAQSDFHSSVYKFVVCYSGVPLIHLCICIKKLAAHTFSSIRCHRCHLSTWWWCFSNALTLIWSWKRDSAEF